MIASDICEVHPHIYHYTTHDGLRGILKSGTLWATHYRKLNDESEITQFKDIFSNHLRSSVEHTVREKYRSRLSFKRRVTKHGGIPAVVDHETAALVNSFYETTYSGSAKGTPPFSDPYIASFCSHANEDSYVQENGLLSQWRAYGAGGGCAIVLNTQGLSLLLNEERGRYLIGEPTHFADVVYDDDLDNIQNKFSEFFSIVAELYPAFLDDRKKAAGLLCSRGAFPLFSSATTRVKHRGFKEEKEVRIVISPNLKERDAVFKINHPDYPDAEPHMQYKTIKYRGNCKSISYIELFDRREICHLPIERIIVGPHPKRRDFAEEIMKIVHGQNITVVCSQTPYIDRLSK